jgi:hypothetical protein
MEEGPRSLTSPARCSFALRNLYFSRRPSMALRAACTFFFVDQNTSTVSAPSGPLPASRLHAQPA